MVILGRVSSSPFSTFISILTYYSWFQVHHYSPWHMFPSDCFIEKCSKRVIIVELIMQILERAIWLNAVLQAEEFPACISYLNSSLTNMDRDTLTLRGESRDRVRKKQCTLGLLIPSGYFFPLYCFSKNNGDLLLSAFHLVVQPHDCNETVYYTHTRYWDSSLKNWDLCAVIYGYMKTGREKKLFQWHKPHLSSYGLVLLRSTSQFSLFLLLAGTWHSHVVSFNLM